ncbi:hypothetical protein PIB30_034960 [Stylosanthes scabra]|uniref:Ubiquitin-like protease family profile domain-containing protein n=1 Tax=Stylosanthes scabra TaxID=79078 RepID=A0ABU6YA76_9FABA|nr:hypothetical protein [Stylosanthes scabra]
MVASVAAQAKEYDPSKAFDLGVGTTRQFETPEMYDLDDFPEEPETPVITAYSLVLNNEPIQRFQSDVYILPPSALSPMMDTYRENYIDLHTRKVNSITSLKSDEHLRLVNKDKLITHRYTFAPVIYSGHWWMYVLGKEKKTFFVVDSKCKDAPSSDRTRINKFAGNMIDQLLVYAGYQSLLTKGTRSKPPQISWFPRYQQIHEQLNA